jgi:Ni/Co efflux regulator RcnB
MKALLAASAALALVAAAGSAAGQSQQDQPANHDSHQGAQGGQGHGSQGQGGHANVQGGGAPQTWRGAGAQGGQQQHWSGVQGAQGAPPQQGAWRGQQGGQRHWPGGQGVQNAPPQQGAWRGQQGGGQQQHWSGVQGGGRRGSFAFEPNRRIGAPAVNQNMRARDHGRAWFNPGVFPHRFNAQRRFHVGGYYRPPGWYFRTWGFGDILPWGWYTSQYYLDWADYGLPPPPVGCEWIREGDDALLVDVWTGQVLSVDYGVFY